jgi:hypothetical protein
MKKKKNTFCNKASAKGGSVVEFAEMNSDAEETNVLQFS